MICSSLYLLFLMSVILHGLMDFSTLKCYGLWGAGHPSLHTLTSPVMVVSVHNGDTFTVQFRDRRGSAGSPIAIGRP